MSLWLSAITRKTVCQDGASGGVAVVTFTAASVLVDVVTRRADAGEGPRRVHTSVLTQKLREAALVQVYRRRRTPLAPRKTFLFIEQTLLSKVIGQKRALHNTQHNNVQGKLIKWVFLR